MYGQRPTPGESAGGCGERACEPSRGEQKISSLPAVID